MDLLHSHHNHSNPLLQWLPQSYSKPLAVGIPHSTLGFDVLSSFWQTLLVSTTEANQIFCIKISPNFLLVDTKPLSVNIVGHCEIFSIYVNWLVYQITKYLRFGI